MGDCRSELQERSDSCEARSGRRRDVEGPKPEGGQRDGESLGLSPRGPAAAANQRAGRERAVQRGAGAEHQTAEETLAGDGVQRWAACVEGGERVVVSTQRDGDETAGLVAKRTRHGRIIYCAAQRGSTPISPALPALWLCSSRRWMPSDPWSCGGHRGPGWPQMVT